MEKRKKSNPKKCNPNSENSAAKQFYDIEKTISFEGKDIILYKCKICSQSKNGNNPANLVSHLRLVHEDMYLTKVKKKVENGDIKMQAKRLKLLQDCVTITTVNKQPFSDLLNTGFQSIINKKLLKLEAAGYGINLKCKNLMPVKNHIHETAVKIREKIAVQIKDRLFSLSADIVTKNNRSILGIFIQYILDGKLQNRCMGMKELHSRHRGSI